MPQVLIVSQHARTFQEHLEREALPDFSAIYCESAAAAQHHARGAEIIFGAPDHIAPLLEDCRALRWIQSSWAGVRPFKDAARRDYLLTGVKDIFGAPMSEYVLGWILALERNILQRATAVEWNDHAERGVEGKTAGIMGTGSIGSHVAQNLRQFGISTRGYNTTGSERPGFDACYGPTQLSEFASELDYLVAVLPDTPDSCDIIDRELLSQLRPGAILINGGRGNCLVEEHLLEAVRSGRVRHAVIDVMREEPPQASHPFWAEQHIYITSHTAAPTRTAAIVKVFADNYRRYVAGDDLAYKLDIGRGY